LLRGHLGTRPLQWAMQVPVIGGCLKTAALSRFSWTLSLTLDAGLDALRALRLSLRSTQNAYYTSHSAEAERVIASGREFHEALRATGVFPEDFLTSLETAELAGTPGATLQRLATEYRERAKAAARILAIAAAFATWIAVAGLLILLIFRIFFIGYLGPMQELQRELRLN
jgi:type IV pilus assembly protein PilC